MARVTDIVVTTIFEPAWLQGYLDNLRAHGREAQTTLRIICDRKTPASVYDAADAARKQGFRIDCPTLDEQSAYLRSLGLAEGFIPWDTDNRRNIGFLRAWESGAEVLISIDDDNYCLPDSDFVGSHHVVGRRGGECEGHLLAQGDWFNICTLLEPRHADEIYPRGYPYALRGRPQDAPAAGLPAEPHAGAAGALGLVAGQHAEHGAAARHTAGVLVRAHGLPAAGHAHRPLRRHPLRLLRAEVRQAPGRAGAHRLAGGRAQALAAQPVQGPLPRAGRHGGDRGAAALAAR